MNNRVADLHEIEIFFSVTVLVSLRKINIAGITAISYINSIRRIVDEEKVLSASGGNIVVQKYPDEPL